MSDTPDDLDPAKNPMLPVNIPEMHLEGERLEPEEFLAPMRAVGEVDEAHAFLHGRDRWALYEDSGEFRGTLRIEAGKVVVKQGGEVKALSASGEDVKALVRRDVALAGKGK